MIQPQPIIPSSPSTHTGYLDGMASQLDFTHCSLIRPTEEGIPIDLEGTLTHTDRRELAFTQSTERSI